MLQSGLFFVRIDDVIFLSFLIRNRKMWEVPLEFPHFAGCKYWKGANPFELDTRHLEHGAGADALRTV